MDAQKTKMTKEELESGLRQHTGSEQWYRHWSGRLVYTDGIHWLAENANAFWLIDLVASYHSHASLKGEEFILWKLIVCENHTASAIAEDGNGTELLRQEIEYSDFPRGELRLYFTDGTLLLPSEY